MVQPHFTALIDDFYAEIERHPQARKVITGGAEQIADSKERSPIGSENCSQGSTMPITSPADGVLVCVTLKSGSNQVYTNAALSRLRRGLLDIVGLKN